MTEQILITSINRNVKNELKKSRESSTCNSDEPSGLDKA